MNTKACDTVHRDLKCCNCPDCAVKRAGTVGSASTNTHIPASPASLNAACFDNTIFILGNPRVNYPTSQSGEIQSQEDRVHQTVCQFLAQVTYKSEVVASEDT